MGLVLVLSLIYSGCESNLLEQAASDYFPIDRKCLWYYTSEGDTIEVYGGEKELIASREATVLNTGTCKEFFYKSNQEIDRLFLKTIKGGDKSDTIFIWTYFLPGRITTGDEWLESYTFVDTIFGDKVSFSVNVSGNIVEKQGDLCEIQRTTRKVFSSNQFGNEDDTLKSHEWYMNGVGLYRVILNEGTNNERKYDLISYTFLE